MWVKFSEPLIKGKFIKRYKRFFADVELDDGSIVTAHCPNTGSMKTCATPGDTVFLQKNDNPKRKLKYTWELTKTKGGYIGINTARPNHVVFEGVKSGLGPELEGYSTHLQEKKYGKNSRIDILLENDGDDQCFVEVKNTTFLAGDRLEFPDAVTSRGLKHIHELVDVVRSGKRGVMFFLCNRPEGEYFAPAADIDPDYASALKQAAKEGVEILAYRAKHTLKGIKLSDRLDVQL
jgi:sugar fermentation stimulation protein A